MQDLSLIRTPVPGPESLRLAKELKQFEAPTVTHVSPRWPVFWKRAQGIHVWDVDDNRYVDLTSAFGVASLGHAHPEVIQAVQTQAAILPHGMGDVHPSPAKVELCRRLSELTFGRWSSGKIRGQTILCNSGFEAIEAALKTARIFTGKRDVISFDGGYHGLGYGALEVSAFKTFRVPIQDQLGRFAHFVPYPRRNEITPEKEKSQLETVEKIIRDILQKHEVGAVVVEPFQGRAGEILPPAGFLPLLRKICSRNRLILIADEIYTGFWRTGQWFAVEHEAVQPDIICLGKALSGCLPISACVGSEDVMAAWPESTGEALHTSTFLGNPMACSAVLAGLKVFERDHSLWNIQERGERFLKNLRAALGKNPRVREIRGIGFMAGIELDVTPGFNAQNLAESLLPQGLFVLPGGMKGEVLTFSPPLILEDSVLDWAVEKIQKSFA